jgi:hypothetical protein
LRSTEASTRTTFPRTITRPFALVRTIAPYQFGQDHLTHGMETTEGSLGRRLGIAVGTSLGLKRTRSESFSPTACCSPVWTFRIVGAQRATPWR